MAAPQGSGESARPPSLRPGSRFRSLYARLALVLLALLTAVGAAWVGTTLLTTRLYQEELEQRLNRDLARSLLSDTRIFERGVHPEDLEHIFHTLMVVNPRIEVYLLDPEGRILAYSAPEGQVVRRQVDLAPVRAFLAGDDRLPIRGNDPRDASRQKIFSAAPIPATEGGAAGYLYVVLGGQGYDSLVARLRSSYILRLGAWMALGAVAAALVAGLFVLRRLTRRLEHLDQRIRGFRPAPERSAGGESGTEAAQKAGSAGPEPPDGLGEGLGDELPAGDEIDRLEAAFTRMAARIDRQVGELTQLDTLRRELVANVSHDLRTPIAAVQGYLETLLIKEDALPPEERRRYLEIAARHSEHLGKLVAQLFELARLDVEEARLEIEPVSLAELAQDVVGKFHLEAERQGVDLGVRLPSRLPYVAADMRLLERALDNLIENALAHTPQGGQVTVEVRETDSGIEVRLADTGSGIPEDELPRIFDRFHRGRDRGRRQRPGVGLGLAITKRILELHGSSLHVESAVGEGTAFTFRLPYTTH